MRVLFISQCSKNAIKETRRVLDQFAERKGDGAWETSITMQGLDTVRRLLQENARKNSAIACHLFRGRSGTELLWIVGNRKKFNYFGAVPTNTTKRNLLRMGCENGWHTGRAISLLASIAALFHDFGKANEMFQRKLRKENKCNYESHRHEWISLLLFRAFVESANVFSDGGCGDKAWLQALSQVSIDDDRKVLEGYGKLKELKNFKKNPLKELPPLAKFVAWLILSHHRIPYLKKKGEPDLDNCSTWMDRSLNALWNSYKCEEASDLDYIKQLPHGTPIQSDKWRSYARRFGKNGLEYYDRLIGLNWFQERFSMHMMRAVLMLADHLYSSGDPEKKYQHSAYLPAANTDSEGKQKQKLDEHNIGVACLASTISRWMPLFAEQLPSLIKQKEFKKRTTDSSFSWQNRAYDTAFALSSESLEKGFFGVNLASTGCGKTFANARIMYALTGEKRGCRFTVALGLRTLTLQTGDSLKERLHLTDNEVAVLIGSQPFKELYNRQNSSNCSESSADILGEESSVEYSGVLEEGPVAAWLNRSSKQQRSNKLHRLVSAPILVCTIDHLIGLTEGLRGGRQIAPLLRMLSSDLVIDEPDDFDVDDFPALCRLVNFAGVFGSRVLISSATIPPALATALFEAYREGRRSFISSCRESDARGEICCAWFDEFGSVASNQMERDGFEEAHGKFVAKRIEKLSNQKNVRRGVLVPVQISSSSSKINEEYASIIRGSVYSLHDTFCQESKDSTKKISIGLVRMANINPMVAIAREFVKCDARPDTSIHYCIYHSQFPLLIRSRIEKALDRSLKRHDATLIWKVDDILHSIKGDSAHHHIFVVFANAVAEVGRDHDYDWAVVEPSSMRSIIQVAGRVQRHRKKEAESPNIHLLQKNIKGVKGENVSFLEPGFESGSKGFVLESKDLGEILLPEQYEAISSIPRLVARKQAFENSKIVNLADLEHLRMNYALFERDEKNPSANMWWTTHLDWCGELQKRTKFRKQSLEEKEYFFDLKESDLEAKICEIKKDGTKVSNERSTFEREAIEQGKNVAPWICCNVEEEIRKLSGERGEPFQFISGRFATFQLREQSDKKWKYHPVFGFFA